jgi:ribonuclease P protein component
MGLRRANRITDRQDFLRLYEKGRKYVHSLAIFFVLPGAAGEARIGLTASRRVGGAVARNRVKRRLREAWRRRLPGLPVVDVVTVARSGLAGASSDQVEEAVERFVCWLKSRKS